MSKKRTILVTSITLLVVIISLGIVKLYQTYAIGNYAESANNILKITVTEGTSVKVPANGYTDVFYMVSNTNPGTVKYGVAYTTDSNITVKAFSTSKDPASGLIEENEKKYVKLRLKNSSTTEKNITLSTILGYEKGGDLIAPSGVTLVTDILTTLAQYITELYMDYEPETITINNINYIKVESQSLINDRLGGTAELYEDGNIRYYGASPNNYIYFNCSDYSNQTDSTCELWRIIGVFDGKVKIIRNESIGQYSWDNKTTETGAEDNYGKNDWTTARLMKLLNPSNYYTVDSNDNGNGQSLYYYSKSGMCFSDGENATTECDFTNTGIKNDTTRNMIAEVIWNLGGFTNFYSSPDQAYEFERGTDVYSGRPTTWKGKIALPYPSDYYYANGSDSSIPNWLYNDDFHWLLTPYSGNNSMTFHIGPYNDYDNARRNFAAWPHDVRPTLYLNSELILDSGDGSSTNPYKLSV